MKITVNRSGDEIAVGAPFATGWPRRAKNIGGRWSPGAKMWVFSAQHENLVLKALATEYGWLPDEEPDWQIKVRLDVADRGTDEVDPGCGIIVRRLARDTYPVLSQGVVLVDGGFPSRAGSRSTPVLSPRKGTILLVSGLTESQTRHCVEYAGAEAIEIVPPAPPAEKPARDAKWVTGLFFKNEPTPEPLTSWWTWALAQELLGTAEFRAWLRGGSGVAIFMTIGEVDEVLSAWKIDPEHPPRGIFVAMTGEVERYR